MAKKVLFINQEITPYVPETELSLKGLEVPKKIQEKGFEIRTFMPKWGIINERRGQLHEVIRLSGMNLIIDDTDHPLIIKVASIPQARVQVYFIDNDDFFLKRQMATDESGNEYDDNGERAVFFARGVLETVKKLRWTPDVIHCKGWMASVIPLYIKTAYRFKNSVAYKDVDEKLLEGYQNNFDFNELSKLAIDYSDGVVAALPNSNEELLAYATQKNIPVLNYSGDDFTAAYADFYNQIAPEE